MCYNSNVPEEQPQPAIKPCHFIGSSQRDLKSFPDAVRGEIGEALLDAQWGGKAASAKPWKGLGSGVLEVVESHDGDAYRAVYTVRLAGAVYVLHAFQKKSKHGIATPKQDVDLIRDRLKLAEAHHAQRYGGS